MAVYAPPPDQSLEREIASRKQNIYTLEAQKDALTKTLLFTNWRAQSIAKIHAVKLEIRKLVSENERLSLESYALTEQNQTLTSLIRGKEQEFLRLRRFYRTDVYATIDMTSVLHSLDRQLNGLNQSNGELVLKIRSVYPGSPHDFGELEADARSLSAHLKELEARREDLKRENNLHENESKKLHVDNATLARRIDALDREIGTMNRRALVTLPRDHAQPAVNTQESPIQNTQQVRNSPQRSLYPEPPSKQTIYARNHKSMAESPDCPICFEPMTSGVSVTNCRHRFHTDCLAGISICPICRKSIHPCTPLEHWDHVHDTLYSQFAMHM